MDTTFCRISEIPRFLLALVGSRRHRSPHCHWEVMEGVMESVCRWLASLQGPHGSPIMVRFPLRGMSMSSAMPGQMSRSSSVSQSSRGKPLLHFVGSLASRQWFNGCRSPSGPGEFKFKTINEFIDFAQ